MNIKKLSDHSVDIDLLDENSVVFDLGGYKGDFTKELLNIVNCYVYIYEPNYRLTSIKELFGNKNKVSINYKGISSVEGVKDLYIGMKSGPGWIKQTGSSYDSTHKDVRHKKIKTELTTLEYEMKKYNIKEIDLIKINIEGEERNVVPILPFNKIKQISISFHEHCNIDGYTIETSNNLREIIKNNGFKEVIYNNYDTLFIREDTLNEK